MKILIASQIDADALKLLADQHEVVCAFDAKPEELQTAVKGCEALIFRSGVKITREVMESSPDLQLIIRAGSGVDNIDMNYVRERQLELHRIPEPGARAVAEISFGFMVALSRSLFFADQMTRQGHWIKHEIEGYLLYDKTLGIVGLGNVGTAVGQLGVKWGMKVIGCVEHPSYEREVEFAARGIQLVEFDEVISRSDYISIHVPLKDSTRNLINSEVIHKMKPGVYLVNLSRGGVLDEEAVLHSMSDGGPIRGVALDVHAKEGEGMVSPLSNLPNVILTPHIGAMTVDTQREIGRRILETVDEYVLKCVAANMEVYSSESEG